MFTVLCYAAEFFDFIILLHEDGNQLLGVDVLVDLEVLHFILEFLQTVRLADLVFREALSVRLYLFDFLV